MLRLAPRLMVVFLCGAALAGCAASASKVAVTPAEKKTFAASKDAPADLEGAIRQVQLQRAAGQYDEAIRTASQLMLVAGDDPRVASEYGKALAQKGRAKDAVEFLTRATQLAPNDWTLYSALGVSYDQLGNPVSARTAYDHALMLMPNEASVLNNYALSRMMAGDAPGARIMMDRAQAAGGASDAKIAANIALVNKLAPVKTDAIAALPKAPSVQDLPVKAAPAPASKPVATAALPPAPQAAPQNAPHAVIAPPLPRTAGVVMQAVPVDPLAGPVKKVATRKPASIAPKAEAKTADAVKPADVKAPALPPMPAPPKSKTADKNAVPALRLTADARTP